MAHVVNDNLVGQDIGGYRVRRLVGSGAMGEVYEASRHQRVAIKIMHQELAEQDTSRERFLREVQLMQAVKHPHIVPILDFGWYGRRLFLVMPFIDSITLKEALMFRQYTPLRVWTIVEPLSQALQHIHLQGIVHRDLKPSNILLASPTEHVFLADFGLGKRPGLDVQITEAGFIVGTPRYMSPEMAGGEEVDLRADIYSLGVLLYQLLLNQLPFDGSDETAILYGHLFQPPPPPTSVRSDFPPAIEAVIMKCLAKDRQERYPSVRHFILDYRRALEQMTRPEADTFYGIE